MAARWTALASVDHVYKGSVKSQTIHFDYYVFVRQSPDSARPPTTYFESGISYAIFPQGIGFQFARGYSLYQMEIITADGTSSQDEPDRPSLSALTLELLFAVRSAPTTTGRPATELLQLG